MNEGERSVPMSTKTDAEAIVRDIKRQTRKKYNAEEKISIILEGFRAEKSIAAICRREGINPNLYYRCSKDFLTDMRVWATTSPNRKSSGTGFRRR